MHTIKSNQWVSRHRSGRGRALQLLHLVKHPRNKADRHLLKSTEGYFTTWFKQRRKKEVKCDEKVKIYSQ